MSISMTIMDTGPLALSSEDILLQFCILYIVSMLFGSKFEMDASYVFKEEYDIIFLRMCYKQLSCLYAASLKII